MNFIEVEKSVPFTDVIKALFWAIGQLERIDVKGKYARIHFEGYVSYADYLAGKSAISGTVMDWQGEKVPFTNLDSVNAKVICETALKDEFFKGGKLLDGSGAVVEPIIAG